MDTTPTPNTAANILNIESLIGSYNSKLETLQKELREQKQMLENLLDNDDEYLKASEDAAKLTKLKTIAKQKVLKSPPAIPLLDKVKESQAQVRELKTGLSDYLSQYVALSGQTQIEGADGVLRQIVTSAKLIVKKD